MHVSQLLNSTLRLRHKTRRLACLPLEDAAGLASSISFISNTCVIQREGFAGWTVADMQIKVDVYLLMRKTSSQSPAQ